MDRKTCIQEGKAYLGIEFGSTRIKGVLIDKDGDLPTQIADAIRRIRTHYSDFTGNRLAPRFTQDAYAQSFFEAIKQYGIQ